jgi:tRNA-(ms[2]io[6]A)-hydroxylase
VKYNIQLRFNTSKDRAKYIVDHFDGFLQDHADCERKASSMAMSFVAKCPDKQDIIPDLIETALEELVHFKQVYELMIERGVVLKQNIEQDLYIKRLIELCRSGKDDRLLDRMIVAAVVEARGAERFRLVAEELKDPVLKDFYETLWISEHKHSDIFLRLAEKYYTESAIHERLEWFLDKEAEICLALPNRAALH